MDVNQSEETKTEDIIKSVSIEINEDKFKEKNKEIQNDLITIKTSFLLKIPYFKFGKTIHFYCCSLKKNQYHLHEIPTPPFTLGPECKYKKKI